MELGVLSGLSFKLYTSERSAGALNLFGFRPTTWDEECQAAAPTVTRNSAELNSALATRDLIGQAKGIIMERFAIDMLRRLSQESNTKLVDIAQRLIETRAGG